MSAINPKRMKLASRWLRLWRQWGKPDLPLELIFSPVQIGEYDGVILNTEIVIRFAGEAFESAGSFLQAFRVLAYGKDITELVAGLANLPADEGKIVILYRDQRWNGMCSVAMAVQAAHINAATAMRDIEAARAMEASFAAEQVAALEADLLADEIPPAAEAANPSVFSARSKPSRL